MDWQKFKLGFWSVFWGAVGGAVLLSFVGFKWGGWVTHGTAETIAEEAVVERLAKICLAQVSEDAQKEQKLNKFKELGSWERERYVEKQGWATMPDKKQPNMDVADECAEKLMQVASNNGAS